MMMHDVKVQFETPKLQSLPIPGPATCTELVRSKVQNEPLIIHNWITEIHRWIKRPQVGQVLSSREKLLQVGWFPGGL